MEEHGHGILFNITGHLCGESTDEFSLKRPEMQCLDVFFVAVMHM